MRFFGREFGKREPVFDDSADSPKKQLEEHYGSLRIGAEKQVKRIETLGISLQIWKKFF